jgi:protein tyrosine/serine phosphatase
MKPTLLILALVWLSAMFQRTVGVILFAAALVLCLTGCKTAPVTHGIPNLALVEPGVWRGGQPNAEGWAWLKSQGVFVDVKLNTPNEASDADALTNGMFLQTEGAINFEQQTLGKPNKESIEAAMYLIALSKYNHQGVYVHCEHGQDRTGLIIGAYRVEAEGWSKSEAYKEMLAHGFHPILRGLVRSWDEDVKATK